MLEIRAVVTEAGHPVDRQTGEINEDYFNYSLGGLRVLLDDALKANQDKLPGVGIPVIAQIKPVWHAATKRSLLFALSVVPQYSNGH